MNIQDGIALRGDVLIEQIDTTGNRTEVFNEKNLIVLGGRTTLANVLAGNSLSAAILDVAFGDDGVLPNNFAIARDVKPSDTGVNRRINVTKGNDYIFSITTNLKTSPKVIVSITVPQAPINLAPGADSSNAGLNGKNISELALMMLSEAFSIKRFPAIPKSPAISLVITWTIYV